MIGQTVIRLAVARLPGPGAADVLAAMSIARSPLSTSTIQNPARNSLASAYGPSVMTGARAPSLTTTLVASGPASRSAASSSPASDSSRWMRIMCSLLALTSSGVHSRPADTWSPGEWVIMIR